jgi:hypothetical protein
MGAYKRALSLSVAWRLGIRRRRAHVGRMSFKPTRSGRLCTSRERALAMVLAAIIAALVLAGALLLEHGWEQHASRSGARVLPAAPRAEGLGAAQGVRATAASAVATRKVKLSNR